MFINLNYSYLYFLVTQPEEDQIFVPGVQGGSWVYHKEKKE